MSLDRERLKVRGFLRRWQRTGEDLCDLYAPAFAEGGGAGDSVTPAPVATGLQCVYRGLGQNSQVVVGGRSYLASHEVELERTDLTAAITPEYQIKVAARSHTTGIDLPPALVTWRNLVNCITTGHDLTKNAGGTAWNAGAFSVEGLTGDGYLEFTGGSASNRVIGLSLDDPDADYATIDFGWYTFSGAWIIFENGGQKLTGPTYIATTVFKIERSGSTIKYYLDGVLKYTSLITSTGTLYVDTSIYLPGDGIVSGVTMNPESSFQVITDKAALTFERPIVIPQPFDPVLRIAATQVIQGYQQ